MKNITRYITVLLTCALLLPSCLKDQHDYFDTKPSERLTAFIDGAKKVLSDNGGHWRMEYFVGNVDQDRGGFNLAMDFHSDVDSVRVYSEEEPDTSYLSFYKFSTDDGPVLSFDTFNPIIHKYGTASSSYYEGRGGDYEFLILSYTDEMISLKGKRSGRVCRLYPIQEDAVSYVKKMRQCSDSFYVSTFQGTSGDKVVDGEIDVTNHQFTINAVGVDQYGQRDVTETETVPYIVTETGLKFYEPFEFLGETLTELVYNKVDTTFTAPDVPALKLKGAIPDDWLPYSFYIGDFIFRYNSGTNLSITLVPEVWGQTFRVKGLSRQFDLMFDYSVKTGRVSVRYQAVAKPDSEEAVVIDDRYVVVLLPWALGDGGSLWMNSELGMEAVWNKNRERPVFNWQDNKANRTFATDSFLLYLYDTDDTAESPYAGAAEKYSFTGGNYQLPYLQSLTKKL